MRRRIRIRFGWRVGKFVWSLIESTVSTDFGIEPGNRCDDDQRSDAAAHGGNGRAEGRIAGPVKQVGDIA